MDTLRWFHRGLHCRLLTGIIKCGPNPSHFLEGGTTGALAPLAPSASSLRIPEPRRAGNGSRTPLRQGPPSYPGEHRCPPGPLARPGRDVGTCNCWVVLRAGRKEILYTLPVEGWMFEFRQVPKHFLAAQGLVCHDFGLVATGSHTRPHSALHLARGWGGVMGGRGGGGAERAGISFPPPT